MEDLILTTARGDNALHLAAGYGHTNTAKALVVEMSKKDLSLANKYGETALHYAAFSCLLYTSPSPRD